jgi:hypothetical protein
MRARSLARRRQVEDDLERELRFHLEQEAAANRESGMRAEEARRAALVRLGGVAPM